MVAVADGGLDGFGLAVADVSTGEFRATALATRKRARLEDCSELLSELAKVNPSEALVPSSLSDGAAFLEPVVRRGGGVVTRLADEHFAWPDSEEEDDRAPEPSDWTPQEISLAQKAAGGLLHYLSETYKGATNPLLSLSFYRPAEYLGLDSATERNLELVANLRDGGKKGRCSPCSTGPRTAMGARELKQWILRPLLDLDAILVRQDTLAAFLAQPTTASSLSEDLREVKDLERLLSRIAYRTAGPRDLKALQVSLEAIPKISARLAELAPSAGTGAARVRAARRSRRGPRPARKGVGRRAAVHLPRRRRLRAGLPHRTRRTPHRQQGR